MLSIIIINYNTFELTTKCIASIYEKCVDVDYEIVLVDNASVECNPDLFKEKFPNINLVKSDKNLGFAGGNNLGIEHSKGEYILLLNSDTELINNAPKICLDYLKVHPEVGMVGCQLILPNGEVQATTRRFRTISWELLEVIPIYKFWSKEKKEQRMLHHYFDHKSFANVDWLAGAFMMFRRSLIDELPNKKLNDRFFMYSEDTLWGIEVKDLGYEIHFLPEAKVFHLNKGSSSKEKHLKIIENTIKSNIYMSKLIYPNKLKRLAFLSIYVPKQFAYWLTKKIPSIVKN